MKQAAIDSIKYLKRDRALSITLDGCDKARFEFSNASQRELRSAKRIARRNERHGAAGVIREHLDDAAEILAPLPVVAKRIAVMPTAKSAHWTGNRLVLVK